MSNSKFNTPSPASLSAGNLASIKRPRILSAMRSKAEALNHAKMVQAFLQASTVLLLEHEEGGDEVACGYMAVSELLADFLDAASGDFDTFMDAVQQGGR